MNTAMRRRRALAALAAAAGLVLAAAGCSSGSEEADLEASPPASSAAEPSDDGAAASPESEGLTADLWVPVTANGDYPDAGGTSVLTVADGTSVELSVTGLAPETAYVARLHDEPCADDPPGGDHWDDPEGVHSELWLEFTTDAAGAGTAEAETDLLPEEPIASIVVFVDDGDRGREGLDLVLCGDYA